MAIFGLNRDLSGPGFSLIEILVALAIVGVLVAMVPRMLSTGQKNDEIAWGLVNTIFARAQLESVANGKRHRVYITVPAEGRIELALQEPDPRDPHNQTSYITLADPYARVTLPVDTVIDRCVIDGIDEMQGGILTSCWIFVYGDGTMQPSTMTITDQHAGRSQTRSLHPLYGVWQEAGAHGA